MSAFIASLRSIFAWSIRVMLRLPLLLLHIFIGIPFTVGTFNRFGERIPCGGQMLDEVMLRWWSRNLLRIFGIRVIISGEPLQPGRVLVVANHLSWLDIQALHSLGKMGFVAKAEIAAWPLIGWLAKSAGTVFHRRGSHDSASGVAGVMINRLSHDGRVAIFPEGGITPEASGVRRFHARLFKTAIETQAAIQPVMLRYLSDAQLNRRIGFKPTEKFLLNFVRILGQPASQLQIHVFAPFDSSSRARKALAAEAEEMVRSEYERPVGA